MQHTIFVYTKYSNYLCWCESSVVSVVAVVIARPTVMIQRWYTMCVVYCQLVFCAPSWRTLQFYFTRLNALSISSDCCSMQSIRLHFELRAHFLFVSLLLLYSNCIYLIGWFDQMLVDWLGGCEWWPIGQFMMNLCYCCSSQWRNDTHRRWPTNRPHPLCIAA